MSLQPLGRSWPALIIGVLLVCREKLPDLLSSVFGRVTKLGFAGVTLEFATAKAFEPNLVSSTSNVDLRNTASYMQINDSTARNFISQLTDSFTCDYALIDLGQGNQWLSSRLYILTILFERMKGLQAFVFLETVENNRKQFLGWAEPDKIRWGLAQNYPWLESAYAAAYSEIMAAPSDTVIVSRTGQMAKSHDHRNAQPAIDLLQRFLQKTQAEQIAGINDQNEWVVLGNTGQWEHAKWLNGNDIEDLLGRDLHVSTVRREDLQAMTEYEQIRLLSSQSERFVTITRANERFDALIKRDALVDKAANTVLHRVR